MDRPFVTDKCTLVSGLDVRACCIQHDWAYWKGGSRKDRLKADNQFFRCIWKTSRFPMLAPIRWFGVRLGGKKFWGVEGVSWNYGWNNFEWRAQEGEFKAKDEMPKLVAALRECGVDADERARTTHA